MENINPIEYEYRKLTAEGRKIAKLYLGNPSEAGFCFPPEILERVYHRYFQNQAYHPHPKGLKTARDAIRDYYLRGECEVDPENILITSGTSESFFYLFSLLAQPGDNILTPNPAYPLFDHIAELARIQLRHYPLVEERNWEIDLEELRRRTDGKTRAIVLISPNNPTGAVTSPQQIQEVVEWANRKGIALICDEVFSEFYFRPDSFPRPMVLAKPKLCFTLNGISKMFALPGLKLGWIAVTGEKSRVEAVVDRLETMNDTFLTCAIPIQEALSLLFSEGKEFLQHYREEVKKRAEEAVRLLSPCVELRLVSPVGGFYLMAQVLKDLPFSEEEFVLRLMREKDLFVHPGYFYDYEKGIHFILSHLHEPGPQNRHLKDLLSFLKEIGK